MTPITIYIKKTAKQCRLDRYETDSNFNEIKTLSSFTFKPDILTMLQEEGYWKIIGNIDNNIVTVNAFMKV